MTLKSKLWTFAAIGVVMLSTSGCAKLKSRDELNKGVQAFRNSKYADAVTHFKESVNLDPASDNARRFLAVSYMVQWVPGADSPDNKKNYDMAEKTFNEILKKDPTDNTALSYLASMAFQRAATGTEDEKHASLEEARKWNERRIEVNPKEAEPYYYLGVIDWAEAHGPLTAQTVAEKKKAGDPGPIKDAKVRAELKEKYGALIDTGIQQLTKCLSLDKENEDAMSYINLLYREKADLEDNTDEAKADIAKAEDWSNKSMDMRKIKASRPAKKTETT